MSDWKVKPGEGARPLCATCNEPREHHGIWPTFVRSHKGRTYNLGHKFVAKDSCDWCHPDAEGPLCPTHLDEARAEVAG